MTRALPFPGYTWGFTQHAPGLVATTLYKLLECAAAFEGESNPGTKITALISSANILTANERDGVDSAWRDYQQLLPTLGLIYSTLTVRPLTLTDAGRLLLSGEIGFSELMSTQALRFQYPNGNNYVIQDRLAAMLHQENFPSAENLMMLHAEAGVRIKPGALLLRVLSELAKTGGHPAISVDECKNFLLPCKTNDEWPIALKELQDSRAKRQRPISAIHGHAKRNVQDWFKFLVKTDFFYTDPEKNLSLNLEYLTNLALVEELCAAQERLDSFWLPTSFDRSSRVGWFNHYGSIPLSSQGAILSYVSESYVSENYVEGIEDPEEDAPLTNGLEITLGAIDFARLESTVAFSFSNDDANTIVERLRQGAMKRHSKTLLHDRIVKQLAERFSAQGAEVLDDPDSIDLFTRWPSGLETIFEIKTVTRRNLQPRLRSAIGQIEEYGYRYTESTGRIPEKVIVLNTMVEPDAWQKNFLTQHMNIGLICTPTGLFKAYPSTRSTNTHLWDSRP